MCSLILFGLVSIIWPGAAIRPGDLGSGERGIFKAGVIFASFPSGVEISFHCGREVADTTLCDASQGRINTDWNLFILGFEISHLSQSFFSSLFLGFGDNPSYPYMGLCHYSR